MEDYVLTITITTSDKDANGVNIAYDGILHSSRVTKMAIIEHIAKTFHLTGLDVSAVAFTMLNNAEPEKKD